MGLVSRKPTKNYDFLRIAQKATMQLDKTKFSSLRKLLLFGLSMLAYVACSPPTSVDVSLSNSTQDSFTWSKVRFGQNTIDFGMIGGDRGGGLKAYLGYSQPITEAAEVILVSKSAGTNKHQVSLLGIYPAGASGKLDFEITTNGIISHFQRDG